MKVDRVDIAQLSPDPANLRLHPEKNLSAIKASLRRFGQQKPIVVDASNVVRAGNGTLAAAIELGWTEIDIVRSSLTGVDAVAYAIADNRTAELAEWDEATLKSVLTNLPDGYSEELGFDDSDIELLTLDSDDDSTGPSDQTVVDVMEAAIAKHEPLKHGTVVRCGKVTLVVACPTTDLRLWYPLATEAVRFVPYPTLLALCVPRNVDVQTLMVQPDGLIAAATVAVAKARGCEVQVVEGGE